VIVPEEFSGIKRDEKSPEAEGCRKGRTNIRGPSRGKADIWNPEKKRRKNSRLNQAFFGPHHQ